MRLGSMLSVTTALFAISGSLHVAVAQITANAGDGVLNAPYRGTINALRECSMDVGYGEVRSHVQPIVSGLFITSSTISVWVDEPWDRSVLRMYEGVDASDGEINLTGTSMGSPATVFPDNDDVKRFSFKAIGTKTLAPQTFTIHFSYSLNGSPVSPTQVITVAPITGSFCSLPGESEAFLLGTPLLEVQVGKARLTVPAGQKAEMIGAAFIEKDDNLGPTGIDTNDVLFPGAAETAHIQNNDQFRLGSAGAAKTDWGTPWPGYLIGFQINSDPFGPDGTHYDSQTALSSVFRRIDFVRPFLQADSHPATLHYIYDNATNNRVTEIRDQATPANVITLTRTSGVVTRIATSDGRGWSIAADGNGWLTQITPDGGKGQRSFTRNSAGRITQVKDDAGVVMYEFAYTNDSSGMPTILTEERRLVDGALRTVVQHEIVSESLQRRKETVAAGQVRQFDFTYDVATGLKHRLASTTAYENVNAGGASYTTTYTNDVNSPTGSMVVTQVSLPDSSSITYDYDAHIGAQSVDFGFRTKSTRTGPDDGSLVTFDATYEFFYTSGGTRLFYLPRIVKQRDGRGALSEVTFDYDNGGAFVDNFTDFQGQDLNRLLSVTGPVISTGPSAPRTPRTRFIYGAMSTTDYWLHRKEVDYASGLVRATDYGYDELLRLTTQTVDPAGESILTRSLYCDTAVTQDRITLDPDGYWGRTRFDNDGRTTATERFLNANAGNISTPCADPSGPVYRTTSSYDDNGRLNQQVVDNKDQDGASLTPATITTGFAYDQIGRLTARTVDPGGIGQVSTFDYNWLGETEREFDTSGRGTSRTYDGRGLVKTEVPLAVEEEADTNLTTSFSYDAMGNLRFTTRPTDAVEERVYDDFDRTKQIKRIAGPDGGDTITTTFAYDAANNVTRTVVDEAAVVLSDTTALFDEGGFNYESRQRLTTNVNGSSDPVTQRKFDWAGNVIEERSIGDGGTTVADRVITTEYDGGNRVERITDSEGGETLFVRDDRGNVLDQTVKIDGGNSAVTTTIYDALSRSVQITSPEDGVGGRPDRARRYDSRGNLLRETLRDAADVATLTTVFGYDNAGRQTRTAVLANPASTILASAASVTTDRVTDSMFDTDGRLEIRRTYNNNSSSALETETTYDALGRIDRVTDPSGSHTDEDYAADGRLSQRIIFDGVGPRTFTFEYDGHDRITQQTAVGSPNLVTMFTLDGLDRQKRITDPKGLVTRTDFDLVGRRKTLVEDDGGALERQTDFGYNRLSQLITQTAKNKTSTGTPLADQLTTYRYDSLGRQTRIVYPDAPIAQHNDPSTCTDCVRLTFDLAGRMTQRIDQRALTTTFTYDDRGLLLTRSTGSDRDTFGYDAVGRIMLADRGTTVNQDAVSHSAMGYTDLGDLDFETQAIAEGTARTTDYSYDQAGNRKTLTYPGTEVLTYTPTAINQVDTVNLNAAPLVTYDYQGRLLDKRRTTTTAPGGTTVYEYRMGYDSHRRVNEIVNRFQPGGGNPEIVAAYGFSHDGNGNPLTQTVADGLPGFVADDRAFDVDRLNRLTGTEYFENGQVESTTFDLVGNRESHTDRTGAVTAYGTVNTANEYPTIGGTEVTYDAAGNLAVDQAGRQYSYDELNRLKQVRNAGSTPLANYTYDGLGRRITFNDPVAAVTTRFYYDGQSVIEERNAADTRVRYHVNGAQYIDERVATFTDDSGAFAYYLGSNNFSVTGTGNADGSIVERLDYSSTGDFAGGGAAAGAFYHDADEDLDIDLQDFANIQNCFDPTPPVLPACAPVHDFDTNDASDGDIDLNDYARFVGCSNGPFVTPDQACGIPQRAGMPPASGVLTLHGRPADILSDGHTLLDYRARLYDPVQGRFLQRDRLGFVDGSSLYEALLGNPLTFRDPFGDDAFAEFFLGSAGRDVSTFDVIFSRETLADVTFGLIDLGTDPSNQARRGTAFREGVISPTISAGEFALTGPTAGIRNILARNLTVGIIFGSGEALRDISVADEVPTFEEFATTTAVFTGAGVALEGVVFVGGRAIALIRQGGRSVTVDVTAQIGAAQAPDALSATPLGQLIQQAQRQTEEAFAAVRAGPLFGSGSRLTLPKLVGLEQNVSAGLFAEAGARQLALRRGEIILETQFQQGAVLRGIDFVSFVRTPEGVQLFLNEVSSTAGLRSPGTITALGLGRGGSRILEQNLLQVRTAIETQVTGIELQAALRAQFADAPIRLMGPHGFRITANTESLIRASTGRDVIIVIVP